MVDLRCRTSVAEATYLLRYGGVFDAVVGVDTGMMHLAGSITSSADGGYDDVRRGNRTVSLFGPTDPNRFRPYDPTGRYNRVLRAPHAAAHERVQGGTPQPWERMARITPI